MSTTKFGHVGWLIAAWWIPTWAAAQVAQNPSPMVEHTRRHPRLVEAAPAGLREELELGTLFIPQRLAARHQLPLVVHFHGGPWLPEVAASQHGDVAVIAVHLGAGSARYARPFREDRKLLLRVLDEAARKARRSFGPLVLSGWSAGYGAIRELLQVPQVYDRVRGVLLIDGLHTGYVNGQPGPLESQLVTAPLEVFVRFARDAVAGRKHMLVTHSEIFPGTFASTTETADYLLRQLGVERRAVLRWGPKKTQQLSEARSGQFLLRGYAGNAAPDHVDQLHALTDLWHDLGCLPNTVAADLPRVAVRNARRVFHNGEHNAFTDLVRFQDRFYLTFRTCPDGHAVHPTSSIIVLSSTDGRDWQQAHRFRVEQRDTRDPHFLIFRDRLFVYTGTWYCGDGSPSPTELDLNLHLGYAAWTEDGFHWQSPVLLEGTFGHYIWRAQSFAGRAYLCGRRKTQFAVGPRGEGEDVESALLESDDGLVWRTRSLFQERRGDETAFLFERDGSIVAIGRRGRAAAQLLKSRPPYMDWQRSELDRYIGGPLLARWGDRYVVGGRDTRGDGGPRTSLYWLHRDELHEFASLPSGGDNSYPGFVALSPTTALLSWYSSHEADPQGGRITAIYMADLEILE